jgi:hypothetical protein
MLIKAKTLIPKTAEKLELSEELVADVVDFYYTELRKRMEGLQNNRLYVPKIGTFYISEKKIKESVDTLNHIVSTSEPASFKEIGILNDKRNLLELHEETHKRIIKEREEYESKKNMGCKE